MSNDKDIGYTLVTGASGLIGRAVCDKLETLGRPVVAIDIAVKNLVTSQCQTAIVGGVNLILDPQMAVTLCKTKMLSPTNRCHTFDESADGYARAEGCGVVLLKRLSDALKDGDMIHAILRGSAVNQDGASGGLTVPNGPAQVKVVLNA